MIEAIWHTMLKLSPWLLLGAAVAGLVHVMLPPGFAKRKFTGLGGVLRAVGFGVPLPLCSCGVVPAGIGLKQEGASDGASIGFLISTPQTGVESIFVSASFLGWPFAVLKVAAAAVTGILGGMLADLLGKAHEAPTTPPKSDCCADTCSEPKGRLLEAILYGSELIRSIWRWLVAGVLISAAITVFLPPARLVWAAEAGVLVSSLLVLVLSVPLYVCATASVPIAAALVSSGFPPGAALVFLMAGPATNAATMGAVYKHFGGRALTVYLATIIVGSLGFAIAFDSLIDRNAVVALTGQHPHGTWWEAATAWFLLALLAYYLWDDLWQWLGPKFAGKREEESHVCEHCTQVGAKTDQPDSTRT